jgi:hypothetical protein
MERHGSSRHLIRLKSSKNQIVFRSENSETVKYPAGVSFSSEKCLFFANRLKPKTSKSSSRDSYAINGSKPPVLTSERLGY